MVCAWNGYDLTAPHPRRNKRQRLLAPIPVNTPPSWRSDMILIVKICNSQFVAQAYPQLKPKPSFTICCDIASRHTAVGTTNCYLRVLDLRVMIMSHAMDNHVPRLCALSMLGPFNLIAGSWILWCRAVKAENIYYP